MALRFFLSVTLYSQESEYRIKRYTVADGLSHNEFYHPGDWPGVMTEIVNSSDGYSGTFLINGSRLNATDYADYRHEMENIIELAMHGNGISWPRKDLFTRYK